MRVIDVVDKVCWIGGCEMTLEVGKTYRIKKALFSLKEGELWTLVDKGLLAYFGEHHFVFINEKNEKRTLVLYDGSDEEMKVYRHFEEYFEETEAIE